MNHKVLLADDSLTIQKVIKITLANQPFEIVDCSTEDDLFKRLPEVRPEIVFLDFNLSEKYTGYELASRIRDLSPSSKVLLLLGTFDTVDDAAMEKCGASDKIVKPFDSNKFIAICKRLVETPKTEELKYPEEKKPQAPVAPALDDQWTVSHSVEQNLKPKTETIIQAFDARAHLNPLDHEVSEWGMSIPGVINDHAGHDKKIDLPPVISLTEHKNKLDFKTPAPAPASTPSQAPSPTPSLFEQKFPESEDLDFPTIEELKAAEPVEAPKPTTSKLISIETFNLTPETDLDFEIEHAINSMEETDVTSIEAQIRDEVEDDLWKVDGFDELKNVVAQKIEEAKSTYQPTINDFDESLFKPLDDGEEIQWASSEPVATQAPAPAQVSSEEIEALIKKHVKEYMDQMFQQKVEKIAWDVIPDLAENLIRQEMSKISNKILGESR